MENKEIVYIGVIVFLFLASSILLFVYYTQDFTEEINFVSQIDIKDVDYLYSGNFIQEINVEIGNLTLTNNGVFDQIYESPGFFGCTNFNAFSTFIPNYIIINLDPPIEPIKISPGEIKFISLLGKYPLYSDDVSLVDLQNSIESIYLYKIPEKELNSFEVNSYNSRYARNVDCNSLFKQKDFLKVIPII